MDCVRETTRAAPKVGLGGSGTGRPVVTLTIIGLCVVSWLLQRTVGEPWTEQLVFSPRLGDIEPYRFLSTAFLHADSVMHILFNMYALWIMGSFLEPVLGRWRFAALYVLSAIGGSVAVLVLSGGPGHDDWFRGAVGASGAVFGLFGAAVFVLWRMHQGPRRRSGVQQMVVLIGINFALGLIIPNISWQGHLGGLVTGLLLGFAYAWAPHERRSLVGASATVAVGVALIVTAVAYYGAV